MTVSVGCLSPKSRLEQGEVGTRQGYSTPSRKILPSLIPTRSLREMSPVWVSGGDTEKANAPTLI